MIYMDDTNRYVAPRPRASGISVFWNISYYDSKINDWEPIHDFGSFQNKKNCVKELEEQAKIYDWKLIGCNRSCPYHSKTGYVCQKHNKVLQGVGRYGEVKGLLLKCEPCRKEEAR